MDSQTNRRDFLKLSAGMMTTAAFGDPQPDPPAAGVRSGSRLRSGVPSLGRQGAIRAVRRNQHAGFRRPGVGTPADESAATHGRRSSR